MRRLLTNEMAHARHPHHTNELPVVRLLERFSAKRLAEMRRSPRQKAWR